MMKLVLGLVVTSVAAITQTSARIPPAAIAQVVHANVDQFRACYDHGRAKNPTLAGRVSTRFVIDANGGVSQAVSDPSTTLPDAAVVACVVATFRSLKFPQPKGGDVTVTYPFDFHD